MHSVWLAVAVIAIVVVVYWQIIGFSASFGNNYRYMQGGVPVVLRQDPRYEYDILQEADGVYVPDAGFLAR